jgi:hypothetical protein
VIHIKDAFFINACSLKNKCNAEDDLLRPPKRASFKGLYASLLILTGTLHGCSLLENAGAILLNSHSL